MTGQDKPVPPEVRPLDRIWWPLNQNPALIAVIGVVVLCLISAVVLRPLFEPAAESADGSAGPLPSDPVQMAYDIRNPDLLYFVWSPDQSQTDIYAVSASISLSIPLNLTLTPDRSEWWPAPSPIDERLAFFSQARGGLVELMVRQASQAPEAVAYAPGSSGLGSSYQIDLSKPPRWSADAARIAFLGQKVGAAGSVDLFVTDVTSSNVYRLTSLDRNIVDVRWMSMTELVYSAQIADNRMEVYTVSLTELPAIPVSRRVLPKP